MLYEDLRILAIDFDPQASLTMFLSHQNSVGLVETTAAQAMLQNVSREELISDFIVPLLSREWTLFLLLSMMLSSRRDGKNFALNICPQNVHAVLKDNIIEKLKNDYDFILVDTGPIWMLFLRMV